MQIGKMFENGGFESNPDLPNYALNEQQFFPESNLSNQMFGQASGLYSAQNPVLKQATCGKVSSARTNDYILKIISLANREIMYLKSQIDQLIVKINNMNNALTLYARLEESQEEALRWKALYLSKIAKQI